MVLSETVAEIARVAEHFSIVYPVFRPYFSGDDNSTKVLNEDLMPGGLFDATPEQISNGKATWDQFGWSRDGWVL